MSRPLHRCLTALEGDHLVLVLVPVRWGTNGITPRKEGLEPVGWGSWALGFSSVVVEWLVVVGEWLVTIAIMDRKMFFLLH